MAAPKNGAFGLHGYTIPPNAPRHYQGKLRLHLPFASLTIGKVCAQPPRIPTVILVAMLHRSSDPSGLLILCAVGFCAGIGLFFYGFRLLQRRRLILDTPFSKIRSASMGMVEVSGLAVGPYTMIAPITARPCYYYRTLVWEWKQSGKNKQWVKVAGECMHVPFFVDDNTGRLLIDPRGADLDLHRDFEQEFCDSFFTTKDPAPGTVRSFLARHGIITNNKIKVEEYCIKPKNSLFILGTLGDNPGVEVTPQPVRDQEAVHSFSTHGFSMTLGTVSFTRGVDDTDFRLASLAQATRYPSQRAPSDSAFITNAALQGRGHDSATKDCGCPAESWHLKSRSLGRGRNARLQRRADSRRPRHACKRRQ